MSNKNNWVVLSGYKMQLRHYYKIGIGERSRFAGVIVSERLINKIKERYIELGGKMKDLYNIDEHDEFDEFDETD